MNTKVIAVGVVVVLAMVSLGAILVFVDFGEKDVEPKDASGRLRIFGNVNDDDTLDSDDLALYQEIISGAKDASNYPLADANQDGVINAADVDMVKDMIAKKSMTINYLNGYDKVSTLSYPINKVVPVDRCTPQIQCIGASSKITGLTIKDDIRYPELKNIPNVGRAQQQISMEAISGIQVDAVVVMNTLSYVSDEDRLIAAGIDVVRVSYENMADELSWAITLGFMLQCETQAGNFVKWCDEVLANIAEKVAGVGEDGRKTTLMGYGSAVAGRLTSYAEVSALAGGRNLADFDDKSRRIEIGSEFILDEKYQAEYMIWSRTMNYKEYTAEEEKQHYIDGTKYVLKTRSYTSGKALVVNGSMQMICRVAYIAGELYPELFGADYGDVIHQHYLNEFCSMDYDVTKGTFLLKKADVGL